MAFWLHITVTQLHCVIHQDFFLLSKYFFVIIAPVHNRKVGEIGQQRVIHLQ